MLLDRHIFKKIINNSLTWSSFLFFFLFFFRIDMIYHRSVRVYLYGVLELSVIFYLYMYMYINVYVSTRRYMYKLAIYMRVRTSTIWAQCVACMCNISRQHNKAIFLFYLCNPSKFHLQYLFIKYLQWWSFY